jgi:hypothetical protein
LKFVIMYLLRMWTKARFILEARSREEENFSQWEA